MITSKRFLAFLIAVGMFESGIFLTDYKPMELATAISIICGIYITGETIRSSNPTKNTTITTDSTSIDNNVTSSVNTVETK